jgi:hypothetical protein
MVYASSAQKAAHPSTTASRSAAGESVSAQAKPGQARFSFSLRSPVIVATLAPLAAGQPACAPSLGASEGMFVWV